MTDMTKKIKSKGQNGRKQQLVGQRAAAADCRKRWHHPGWEKDIAEKEMKKKDVEKRMEVQNQQMVSHMIKSAHRKSSRKSQGSSKFCLYSPTHSSPHFLFLQRFRFLSDMEAAQGLELLESRPAGSGGGGSNSTPLQSVILPQLFSSSFDGLLTPFLF